MMSVFETIRECVAGAETPDPDPDLIVTEILNRYPTRKALAVAIEPILHDRVVHAIREYVRSLERVTPLRNRRTDGGDPVASRRLLLASTFYTGQRRVAWGEATVQDHEDRIDYLERYRSALAVSVDKHREAIAEITSHNVSCLNQIRVAS